ncbi:DUF397 domain-containing protein [Streptomyces sp. IB201691-2A2]|uniref:DUF397 domain-containing protein n=1 Tax=Streptomyces sp. IB201691-2A2 TaxID=2561920 RepID=UPI00117C7666|nr:DUF397 domain-containing protein [Streptomyces sp. IB201691-2A2]TRO62253.1 DUF397 domain-containing protein [Streptomyces sp. IB201691-2A2]
MNTDLHWFKSSYSGDQGECVEIAIAQTAPTTIHIRDSKTPAAPTLKVTPTAWSAFLPHASARRTQP